MKQFNPGKYGDFSKGEVLVIIQLSAAMLSMEEIKTKFYSFTERKKRITSDQIIEIQADFGTLIEKKSKEYLKNIEGNPLAHPRILLDAIYDIYKESRKKTPSGSVKTSETAYEIIEKEDLKTALAALKLAIDYQTSMKRIQIEEDKKRKDPIPESIPTEWEIDDQLNLN